ncbi:unnamed protein product, partial [Hapterophycus canaliculatus]
LSQICGGFRRGKKKLHDVDLLVSFRRGNGGSGHEGFVEVHILYFRRDFRGDQTRGHQAPDSWLPFRTSCLFHQGLKDRLVEKGKLCATLFEGHMGGFAKKKKGVEANPPKLERELVLMALWQLPGRVCRIDIVQV